MSYLALYRKFRPNCFEDVKGQEHIVTTLKNQIEAQRIGHAYLFCGTRGTGKTTIAKIFAKAVNCEHQDHGSPCGMCSSCQAIANGSSMNVIEIDAASNNGVDNIREIREEVTYSPTEGNYRVYIIDEVHMLSIGAFNALLKVLEEPPSYVIFILATTESHKIPVTILSRCQRYDFHRISIQTITDRLSELMEKEKVETEEKALRYIAKAADGSMRDALSLLDQCIAFYLGQKLTYERVLDVLGAVDTEQFEMLLKGIISSDTAMVIRQLEKLVMEGRELGQFVTDFTWYLRNLMLVQIADNMEEILDMSTENIHSLKEAAGDISRDTLIRYIKTLSELSNELKYSSQKRILTEIALIRLMHPQMEKKQDLEKISRRIETIEQTLQNGVVVSKAEAQRQEMAGAGDDSQTYPDVSSQEKKPIPRALPEEIRQIIQNWRGIISYLRGREKIQISRASLSLSEQGELLVVMEDALWDDHYQTEEPKKELEQIILKKTGKQVSVRFVHNQTGRPAETAYSNILEEKINFEIEEEEE